MPPSSRAKRPAKESDAALSTLVTLCSTNPTSWSARVLDAANALGPVPASARAALQRIVQQAIPHVDANPHCLDVAHTLLLQLGNDLDTQRLRYSIARALLSAGRDATEWACALDDGIAKALEDAAVPASLAVGCVMVLALVRQEERLLRTAPQALRCLGCVGW